ncbi:uncharacterized protein LOC135336484 isoform X2 [Halichondria panicea]|uniref:uncharacterized protein LOC135336484 isoform X1 n=1 Tax=Halichondria panicea TaxID=6063 RepID=UPI00312B7879
MFVQSVTFLFLLFSLRTNGLGTKQNQFPFVDLGSNGVSYEDLYQYNSDNYRVASPIYPGIKIGLYGYFNSAYINQNGAISFQKNITYRSAFSSISQEYVIAPFWDDMYFNSNGHVRYEVHVHNEYQSSALSMSLKKRVENYIGSTIGVYPVVKSLLVVEWKGMIGYSSSRETNTFQAIVASSDSESYAIFTYQCGGMLWSSSDATIGFGDPYGHYRNHPYSRSLQSQNPIACLNSPNSVWSNVVYKLRRANICTSYEFGCTDGSCVNNRDHCNGLVSDCRDGTDEIACTSWHTPSCRNSQYSCVSGGCVESSLKCDGRDDDCADGSDESNCSSYDVSTGAIFGISIAGVVVIFVFVVAIVTAIHRHLKQRNQRRVQFQRLRSELTVRPQPTPQPQTLYYQPKPEEWYQTVEGQWVQGPPPAYVPDVHGGFPSEGGAEVELIGGVGNSNETEVVIDDSAHSTVISVPPPNIPDDQSSLINDAESFATNEVGVVSNEENSLDNSSSESSLVNNEDTPLIESSVLIN